MADAAITLLAEAGVHGVTHRAVEKKAGLPGGTASNYFRSREALLVATAERIVALHHVDMDAAAETFTPPSGPPFDLVVDLWTGSLLLAATTYRPRYLAIFDLRLESLRRPALAAALADLVTGSVRFTTEHHAALNLSVPPQAVPTMITLYGGALFSLVTAAPADVTEEGARAIAEAIARGALGDRPAG